MVPLLISDRLDMDIETEQKQTFIQGDYFCLHFVSILPLIRDGSEMDQRWTSNLTQFLN
ncbi:hypothetical protein Syun_006512 [Stephania yunnanensis]|uniref:Uncharacterized protein n=1 Tax=Stephania yunnanensis TaxID=152371 RepID=A0AAP0KX06_9MAGN